ncbi:MAG: hypothetical protein JJ868_08310 [Shimia sp.]|uniref:hypothetical protein n=1 Tax=Shimia sp. TaxID=1954381 RepID=UPI001B04247F|nr:hypothetical protein [Shimia sp.]MBO6897358.1 hypothetical protein [Shimia sp.]
MTTQDTSDLPEVLATITASPMRRLFGMTTLFLLGGVLIYIALTTTPALHWRLFLLVIGGLTLWLAETTRRATEHSIELTRDGMRSTSGEEIAALDDIAAIKRGMFDLKPSNGFTVHLKKPRSRRWQPGLWWAFGRRVGIGGVTPGSEAKSMAQILEALLVERGQTEG